VQTCRVPTCPSELLAPRAWTLRHTLSIYDASYVALAELLQTALVTLDRRIAGAPGLACSVLAPLVCSAAAARRAWLCLSVDRRDRSAASAVIPRRRGRPGADQTADRPAGDTALPLRAATHSLTDASLTPECPDPASAIEPRGSRPSGRRDVVGAVVTRGPGTVG